MHFSLLPLVRARNPLVHNITNAVAAHFSANGLLAIGASPIMADEPREMVDMVAIANALLINLGTLNERTIEAMLLAGKAANAKGIPVVLDPVGVAATPLRCETAKRLLDTVKFSAIRGNISEMAFLAGEVSHGKGVDAGEQAVDGATISANVARQYGCVAAVSGKTDYISDGTQVLTIDNGTPLFPKITVSGCLLGSVIAAFLAVAEEDNFSAVAQAVAVYAVAGELAAKGLQLNQSGSFSIKLIDTLGGISVEQMEKFARVQQVR